MTDIPHYERPEQEQEYYAKLVELLDHYENGWELLIEAEKTKDYDYPLPVKEEHQDNPYIPQTWLELADKVIQIIAVDKYELDVYPNTIEIIRADQMLDAYTTTGLPDSYPHWSHGKRRMIEEKNYDSSKHLAYEIVINSSPCLAYCMDTNSPLLQMIVIAHASYGHNAAFKNNFLLGGVDAETILVENQRLRDFVLECEEKYGVREVSDLLDFCHSMKFIDTDNEPKRTPKRRKEMMERAKNKHLAAHLNPPHQSVFNSVANENETEISEARKARKGPKNILGFMADNAPHMPQWKRDIMHMISRTSEYFKPQMMTKVLNEGMATFTHDRIITTMRDIGLIDFGMYNDYIQINQGVLYQQPGAIIETDPETGEQYERLVGAEMNPYTLGLKILEEIERICKNPTEEDKEWFSFAGESDWLSVVKHAVFSSSDETFVEQYLSPQAMRDMKMFMVETLDPEDMTEEQRYYHEYEDIDWAGITAVQAGEGFRKMRAELAKDYRISEKLPHITLHEYRAKTDRCLVLRHHMFEDNFLDPKDTEAVLEYMHSQWEHPIIIESVDEDGILCDVYASPPEYLDEYDFINDQNQPSLF